MGYNYRDSSVDKGVDKGVVATYKSCLDMKESNSKYSYHVLSKDIAAKAKGTRPNFE